jgi:hypothetical protein
MLFHGPDGASGTLARGSVATGLASANGDPDSNVDEVSAGLVAGEDDGEPVAVAPTQPPSRRSSMRERVRNATVEGRVIGAS